MHKLLASLLLSVSLQACVMHGVSTMPPRPGMVGSTAVYGASPMMGGGVAAGPQGASVRLGANTPNGPVGVNMAAGPNGLQMGATVNGTSVQQHAHAGPGGLQMGTSVATPGMGVRQVGVGVAVPVR